MCACVYVCICACSKRQASGRHRTRGIECAPSCIGTSLSVDTLTTLMLIYQTNTTTNPETSPHPLTARLSLATAILIRRHRGFPWWQSRRSAGRVHVCMCVCMHMCMWLSLVAVSPIGRPCATRSLGPSVRGDLRAHHQSDLFTPITCANYLFVAPQLHVALHFNYTPHAALTHVAMQKRG